MLNRLISVIFTLALTGSNLVLAQALVQTAPEGLGLSSDRLFQIDAVIQQSIKREEIAGAVALVARKGQIAYLKPFGTSRIKDGSRMESDTIFRIASMTKPITSVAIMMLHEEGRFRLADPVSKYIPEFKNARVLVPEAVGDENPTMPARREIRVHDLLTHTSGLTYHWNPELAEYYNEAKLPHGLSLWPGPLGEKIRQLALMPLVNHPGEAWEYGMNTDVLGYLVEVLSGAPLDKFLAERIFEPIGMKDTHFYLPADKVERLASVYSPDESGGLRELAGEEVREGTMIYSVDYPYEGPKSYYSGGGGLCSTAHDYYRFCQMMLNAGELGGTRLLSRKTVELMTSHGIGDFAVAPGVGFGLGFSVITDRGRASSVWSDGSYAWGGFFYTAFQIDPQEDLIAIFLCQLRPNNHLQLDQKVIQLAAQSIID
jgi:CubicO group peptidase (beta-lactamase class C family)